MIVRVAVGPHPPLLVPELAAGPQRSPLRRAMAVCGGAGAGGVHRWVYGHARSGCGDGAELLYSVVPYGVAYHVALRKTVEPEGPA
jgi:hypothetical protein